MPAAKKKGRPTRTSAAAKQRAAAAKQRESDRYQLAALILFGLAALFVALTVIKGNPAWNALREALFGVFGIPAYFIGPLLLAAAVMCTYEKRVPGGKIPLAVLIMLSVCGLFLVFSDTEVADGTLVERIKTLYAAGAAVTGGGVMSAVLGLSLLALCGRPAANIVLIVLLFILVMIFAGKTLASVIETVRAPVEKTRVRIREDREALRETREEHGEPPSFFTEGRRYKSRPSDAPIDIPLDGEAPKPETVNVRLVRRRAFGRSSIDVPLGPMPITSAGASDIDVPLGPQPIKPTVSNVSDSSIDIPLGPVTEKSPAQPKDRAAYSRIDKNQTARESTAEFVRETFEDAKPGEITENDIFARFGRSPTDPDTEKLVQRAAQNAAKSTSAAPSYAVGTKTPAYRVPPFALLAGETKRGDTDVTAELRANAEFLVSTLESFGVETKIVDISRGPTVTRYELQPQRGVRISRIANLADDISLSLATAGVRIEAPIPNKAAVGIEVPNKVKQIVPLRAVLESREFSESKSPLTVALGKDISGGVRVTDISKMPHLLIAGTTGSGKSKCLHSMIISMMYKSSPEDLRFVMIDPKMVEFGIYNGIPHMLIPVVTDARKAAGALGWAVGEMLKRYKLFSENAVRDIDSFNKKVETLGKNVAQERDEDAEPLVHLPRVVVVIDELADLMMAAPNEVEDAICRLAQMARAAGLHLIIATQRPSVDVITGIIKANISSRVALAVASQVDSRTILDGSGAEKLLGHGDMLFRPMDMPKAVRIQGCFVSDDEVERVIAYVKQNAVAQYNEQVLAEIERQAAQEKGSKGSSYSASEADSDEDNMLDSAVRVVIEAGQASTSLLQRKLRLGYSRAARIMDEMENMGIIGPPDGSKPRRVNLTLQQWEDMKLRADD